MNDKSGSNQGKAESSDPTEPKLELKQKLSLKSVLILLFTSAWLVILFFLVDTERLIVSFRNIPVWVLCVNSLISLLFFFFGAIRWKLILETMDYNPGLWRCLVIIMGIWPLSSFSPSKSGDLLRAYSLRKVIKPSVIAGSVITERLIDVFVLAVAAFVGGLFFNSYYVQLMAIAVLVLSVSILVAAANVHHIKISRESWQNKLINLAHSLRCLPHRPVKLVLIVVVTSLKWLASILQAYFLFVGLQADVSFPITLGGLPIAIFAGQLPVTIAGMATRESAMILLFQPYTTMEIALTVSLMFSVFGHWLPGLIGLFFTRKALD